MLSLFRKKRQQAALKAVFFDLDGTLLDVEMSGFIATYIEGLSIHFADVALRYTVRSAFREAMVAVMAGNGGFESNEKLFFAVLRQRLGIDADFFYGRLDNYCDDGLLRLQPFIRPLPLVRQILERCRDRDLKVVLATNPIFPRSIIDARLEWGGIADFPFDLVTSLENTRFCKPDPRYYKDLLDGFDLAAKEAIMVGNDTENDLAARAAGMKTFLVETCLIDRGNGFRPDYRGSHQELLRFLEENPTIPG
jgi:FMN phosphatase YigB (HAD superfamily)